MMRYQTVRWVLFISIKLNFFFSLVSSIDEDKKINVIVISFSSNDSTNSSWNDIYNDDEVLYTDTEQGENLQEYEDVLFDYC